MFFADEFLKHDGHFLLVDEILRGGEVGLAVGIEDGGVDGFDGGAEHTGHGGGVGHVWNHVGGVDTGEGLIVGVFEERG